QPDPRPGRHPRVHTGERARLTRRHRRRHGPPRPARRRRRRVGRLPPHPPRRPRHTRGALDTVQPMSNGTASSRLLRGYGPLVAFVVVFLLIAILVPTADRPVVTRDVASGATGDNGGVLGEQQQSGDVASGGGSATGGGGATASGGGTVKKGALPPGVKGSCPDRTKQVPNDPYSPPCISFSGSNGGATTKGVTGDSIIISARITNDPGFQQALAQAAGARRLLQQVLPVLRAQDPDQVLRRQGLVNHRAVGRRSGGGRGRRRHRRLGDQGVRRDQRHHRAVPRRVDAPEGDGLRRALHVA